MLFSTFVNVNETSMHIFMSYRHVEFNLGFPFDLDVTPLLYTKLYNDEWVPYLVETVVVVIVW
jgi:hypothetical protein